MSCSALALTLNEHDNLPGCLESVAWCDDIVVFDSYSTDGTAEIARAAGARFIQRRFDNYSDHRNWAFRNIEFRNPWVLSLDADERCTPGLAREISELAPSTQTDTTLFRIRRKDYLSGRWCKRSSSYPVWLGRLARPNRVWFESRSVNAHPLTDGAVGHLEGHLVHYPFGRGIADWLAKHNRYSTMEARECLKALKDRPVDCHGLFSRDSVRRRRALKELSFRLPARPWFKFVYTYFLRMGFLDGGPGLTYCTLQAIYEYMICLKIRELKRRERGLPI